MSVDVSGIIITPGDGGKNCMGNGEQDGNLIECCCDECNYLLCCVYKSDCEECSDIKCPKAINE